MRYYSFAYPLEDGQDAVETLSEDEIRNEYYPYWYDMMCKKYDKDYVDTHFSFEECLGDWIVVHWAWEVTKD